MMAQACPVSCTIELATNLLSPTKPQRIGRTAAPGIARAGAALFD